MQSVLYGLKQVLAAVVATSLIFSVAPPPSRAETQPSHVTLRPRNFPALGVSGRHSRLSPSSASFAISPEFGNSLKVRGSSADHSKNRTVIPLVAASPAKLHTPNLESESVVKPSHPGDTKYLVARPLAFIQNKGQFNNQVKFQVSGNGKTLWLTDSGIVFDFAQAKSTQTSARLSESQPGKVDLNTLSGDGNPSMEKPALRDMERHVIYQDFVGANHDITIETKDPQPGDHNYLTGSDPSKWQTQVHGFSEIVYHEIWKGVDLRLYGKGPDLEQEFIVRPGADLGQVHVAYQGIDRLEVAKDGSLVIRTTAGEMRESAPRIYQEIAGHRTPVEGRFKLLTATSYTFQISPYNKEYALVVDPTLLYSTFLGGSSPTDTASGIAVDASGNAYIAGNTGSTDFPTTPGAYRTTIGSPGGMFVTKLNPSGSALVYSTYLTGASYTNGIAVDAQGNAYVAGLNAWNVFGFPTTSNAYNQSCSASGFLTVLNQTGTGLVYSTCFGDGASVSSMAVDGAGHAFIAGSTNNPALPTTLNAYQPSYPGSRQSSAFAMSFDTTASGAASLTYSTYFGISSSNSQAYGTGAYAIAADLYGNMYITGFAGDSLPVTVGAFQSSLATGVMCNPFANTQWTCPDGFVAKFNPSASGAQSLIYSTYIGGPGNDAPLAIAVDSSGNAYVTGYTFSQGFPVTPGAFQSSWPYSGNVAVSFVSKLNAAGSGLLYSTYLAGGGVRPDVTGYGIALDSLGDAYVTGVTVSAGFPVTPDAFQSTFSNANNGGHAFLTKFNPNGSALLYSSYLSGGLGDDVATSVAVDQTGDAYVAGHTSSGNFPTTVAAFQQMMNGTGDAFVTKFPLGGTFRALDISPKSGGNAGVVTVTAYGSGFHAGMSLTLRGGTQDIIASPVTVGATGSELNATFDLHGALPGARDLVFTNTDGTTLTISNAFTVTNGGAPNLWVQIVGRGGISPGSNTNIDVVVGNQGSVDAVGVPVTLAGIPSAWKVTPDFAITPPPPIPGAAPIDWSAVPIVFDTNSSQGQVVPLFIPFVAPHSIVALHFTIYANDIFPPTLLQANVGAPFFQSPMSPAALNCLQSLTDFAWSALGLFPLASCASAVKHLLADQFLLATRIGYMSNSQVVFSLTQNLIDVTAFALSSAECGIKVIPGLGQIVAAFEAGYAFGNVLVSCLPVLKALIATLSIVDLAPHDPNEKLGAGGVGQQKYLSGSEVIPYSVLFENEPTATAPAQTVTVTDVLDPSLDLSRLRLGAITIGGKRIPTSPTFAPKIGLYEATANLDLRPTLNLLMTVDAKLDPSTRTMTWTFNSIDPSTGMPPIDPTIGFLAPGMEGSVFFSANPVLGLTTGTQIVNQASVVFNNLAPISTLPWTNTLDSAPPTSQVSSLPPSEGLNGFTVLWTGTDVGSGIQDFTIYVADNGGPFTVWQQNTTSTSATFTGQLGHTYGFYSIARDLVGNVEAAKSTAEATTQVTTDTTPPVTTAVVSAASNGAGWNNSNVTITLNSTDNEPGGTGVKQIQWSLEGAQTGSSTVPGNTTTVTISTEGTTTLTYFGTDNAGNVEGAHTLTIKLDNTPPVLTIAENPPPNANGWNNTDVIVSFVAVDTLSGVGMVSGPVTVTQEGAGQVVTGSATDVAGNLVTGSVVVNLDNTPPEAFLQFDPVSHDVVLFGRDSLSGVAPGPVTPISVQPVDKDKDKDDGEGEDNRHGEGEDARAEIRTYNVLDLAGNSLLLVEKVRKHEHEISARILSLQYNGGAIVKLPRNEEAFEWELSKDGTLRELHQEFRAGRGEEDPRVEAQFRSRRNQTVVVQQEPEPKTRVTKPGLDLLRMATSGGKLTIEF